MNDALDSNVTVLLKEWTDGKSEALEQLITVLYDDLKLMAANYLRKERNNHTIQPTSLINESYLRLVKQQGVQWQSRSHFFAVAAQIMRHVLVDYARTRNRAKRDGQQQKISLTDNEIMILANDSDMELIALDDALKGLAKMNPTHSKIVELRFFGGLSIEETATVLEVSPRTVSTGWELAKLWLYKEVKKR